MKERLPRRISELRLVAWRAVSARFRNDFRNRGLLPGHLRKKKWAAFLLAF